jgi:hypothetical protein
MSWFFRLQKGFNPNEPRDAHGKWTDKSNGGINPAFHGADWTRAFDHARENGEVRSAVRDPKTGKVYTGYDHEGALNTMHQQGNWNYKPGDIHNIGGFVMPNGRFWPYDQVSEKMK